MRDYILNNWQDFWKLFDELIGKLNSDNKDEIAFEFNEAMKLVNGLTDGWYEFKFAFEKLFHVKKHHLTKEEYQLAEFLLITLNKSFPNDDN